MSENIHLKRVTKMHIPFNKPYLTGREIEYIAQTQLSGRLSGNGAFTQKCQHWLLQNITCQKALLTHTCTAALEMAAILIDTQPGDEIIMPSYTYVSTANAFVLRGGIPVFVDIREDTFNIDENKIEAAISPRTKAIVPVHYAGVSCEMDTILSIAKKHNLFVIEDAAQGIMSSYKGRPLGSMGHLAALSFHETKNIISGEGGALLINDKQFIDRAEILLEKGTNRSQFLRGEIDQYSWINIGSSFAPSELVAAFLWAQMEEAEYITQRRLNIWNKYHDAFKQFEVTNTLRRPIVPLECQHNAHLYPLILRTLSERTNFIASLKKTDIHAVFHYIPLHTSIAGKKYSLTPNTLLKTVNLSERLVRLPLWLGLENHLDYVISSIKKILEQTCETFNS